jgi:outer membrane cobalamin receptor
VAFLTLATTLFLLTDSITRSDTVGLNSSDTVSLKEVVVSSDSGKGMAGMKRGKITFQPDSVSILPSVAGNTDLLKLLELTPGVQNPGDANSNLYVRGGDAGQTLILYADAPLYTPGHLFGFFPLFNADHISSLEMSASSVNARYGGRMGAVVETRVKNALPEKTSLTGNTGLLASQATLALPLSDKFGIYLSGRKTYINLLVQPLIDKMINSGADRKIESPDYNFGDANLTLTGKFSDKDNIQIDAFYSRDNLALNDADILLDGMLRWTNLLVSARWEHKAGDKHISQQVFASSYGNNVSTGQYETKIFLNSAIKDYGYKARCMLYAGSVPIEAGVNYSLHTVQPQSYSIINKENIFGQNIVPEQKASEAGIYLSAFFRFLPQFEANAGLRCNLFANDKIHNSLEPRLSLTYRLTDNSLLRASFNRQTQFLHYLSPTSIGLPLDFWALTSKTLPPQSSDGFSAGYYKSFGDNDYEFSADAFLQTMKNLNEYVQTLTAGEASEFSGELFTGDGQSCGLEFLLKKNGGRLTGWLSYTLARSFRRFPQINDGQAFPAKFDRRHDLSLVTAYSVNRKISLSAVFAYATGNAYTLPSSWYFIGNMPVKSYASYNGSRMPAYRRIDFSAVYRIDSHNELALSVYNCFATNNPVYIFMNVERDRETGKMFIKTRYKQLTTITPAVSWRFKF